MGSEYNLTMENSENNPHKSFGRREFLRKAKDNAGKIAVTGGVLATGGVAVAVKSFLDGENERPDIPNNLLSTEVSPKKPRLPESPRVPAVAGENLIYNSNFEQSTEDYDSQRKKRYSKPVNWVASNTDQSKYLQGVDLERASCLEVDASKKSSWQSEKPIKIENGTYFIAYEVKINKEPGQNVSNVRPKISIIPVNPDGSIKAPIFSDMSRKDGMTANEWNPMGGEIKLDISEPQEVIFELSGFDLPDESTDPRPKTIRYSNVKLQRMIQPGEPNHPDNRNTNRGSA